MAAGAAPVLPLAAAIAFIVACRIGELRHSAKNERRLEARGGREATGGPPFALFAALHAAFPLALVAEVVLGEARPGRFWPLWLGLGVAAEVLRFTAIRTLGDRWTTRIYVVPGELRVRRGIYRFLEHPNYLGVILELAAIPLLFGAWRTALLVGIANAGLVAARVRAEARALAEAEANVGANVEAERAAFDRGARSE